MTMSGVDGLFSCMANAKDGHVTWSVVRSGSSAVTTIGGGVEETRICHWVSGAEDTHSGVVAKTIEHGKPSRKYVSVEDEASHTGDDAFDHEATSWRGRLRRLLDVVVEAK